MSVEAELAQVEGKVREGRLLRKKSETLGKGSNEPVWECESLRVPSPMEGMAGVLAPDFVLADYQVIVELRESDFGQSQYGQLRDCLKQ